MDYIDIKGYKSIKNLHLELKPINILIGSNGSGKSNFLSFFEFLNALYNQKLSEYIALNGGDHKILYNGLDNSFDELSFKMEFDNGKNGYEVFLKKGNEGLVFTDEYLLYKSEPVDISQNKTEARIKIADNYRAKYVIGYLRNLKKYHFHDTGRNSPFNQMSNIENDKYFLYERGLNLAAFLYNIQQSNKIVYNRIVKTIQSIAPYFSDFYFQPNKEGFLKLQWQDKYSSIVYGATDLSDGTIRFMALAVLFLQPNLPESIIIDEPELGLHPFAIAKLAGLIQSVASKNCQVILATQSADLVNHFRSEEVITVNQINGESSFERLKEEDLSVWLDEYSIGDLWQKNIINKGQPN